MFVNDNQAKAIAIANRGENDSRQFFYETYLRDLPVGQAPFSENAGLVVGNRRHK